MVAGLATLLAACGGPPVATHSGSPGTGAPAPASAPATAATAPAPTPTPTASATGGAWTGLRWDAPTLALPDENIGPVIVWDGTYVAVGQLQTANGSEAAAWVSADWHIWKRTLLDVPAAGDSTLGRVFPVGSRLVAIGSSGTLHCVPPPGEGQVCDPLPAAVWISATCCRMDLRGWPRLATNADPGGIGGRVDP